MALVLRQLAKNRPGAAHPGGVELIVEPICGRSAGTPGKGFPGDDLAALVQLQQPLLTKYRIQPKFLLHPEESVVRDNADHRLTVRHSFRRCSHLSNQRINLFQHRKSSRAIGPTFVLFTIESREVTK